MLVPFLIHIGYRTRGFAFKKRYLAGCKIYFQLPLKYLVRGILVCNCFVREASIWFVISANDFYQDRFYDHTTTCFCVHVIYWFINCFFIICSKLNESFICETAYLCG